LDKAIPAYNAVNNGNYPDGWDSLTDSTGVLYSGLPGGATGPLSTYFAPRALTQNQVNRLNRAWITTVQLMRSDPTGGFGATYFCYGNGLYTNPQTLSTTASLVFVQKNSSGTYRFAPWKIYLDDTHDYILVGVGQACSLMGASGWAKDCPVLRHSEGCSDPALAYCRACAIFDLGVTSTATSNDHYVARFVGTICLGNLGPKFSDEMTSIPQRME
jgi:hypothetical protein